jgi:16S rRNA (guanine966-N2)-methyltransferase
VRIIAGEWRGRRLTAPTGDATRPTADRTRETLFSMLASRLGGFTGITVADLFAGSGALGLEALSRGAASCLFVDTDRAAIATIRANVAALGTDGASVRQGSSLTPGAVATPFDLILIDPPYGSVDEAALIDSLDAHGWIGEHSMIALETARGRSVTPSAIPRIAERDVGKARLHLFQR